MLEKISEALKKFFAFFCLFILFFLNETINSEELAIFSNQGENFNTSERLVKVNLGDTEAQVSLYMGTYFYSPFISKETTDEINRWKIAGGLTRNETVSSAVEVCAIDYDKYRVLHPFIYVCIIPNEISLL